MSGRSSPQMYNLTPDGQSWVFLIAGWLPSTVETFSELLSEKPVQIPVIKMFGKAVQLPRYNQSYGADYKFSGVVSRGKAWTPLLGSIRDKISEDLKAHLPGIPLGFNMALVNWYMSGEHYIGPHSDEERDFVGGSPVATLSWGSSREFLLEPKKGVTGETLSFRVNDGDLLLMGGTTQKTHKHSVPKSRGETQPRISLTFRVFTNPIMTGTPTVNTTTSVLPTVTAMVRPKDDGTERVTSEEIAKKRFAEEVKTTFTSEQITLLLRTDIPIGTQSEVGVERDGLLEEMRDVLPNSFFTGRERYEILRRSLNLDY